jgi:hypothetical protein
MCKLEIFIMFWSPDMAGLAVNFVSFSSPVVSAANVHVDLEVEQVVVKRPSNSLLHLQQIQH